MKGGFTKIDCRNESEGVLSITYCDGTVRVVAVGTAEGHKKLHLGTIGVIV